MNEKGRILKQCDWYYCVTCLAKGLSLQALSIDVDHFSGIRMNAQTKN